jgi:methionine-rich copper-binding protein CopC
MPKPFVLALAFALAAGSAAAHSVTLETVPADGATVAAAPELSLGFDSPMVIVAFTLERDGEEVAVERLTGMEPATGFRAVPAGDLAPGAYRVEWRGLSDDGHAMQGGFTFTVAP